MQKVFDVHTHFNTETSRVAEDSASIGFTVTNRSSGEHLASMERLGISFSLISCPTLKFLDQPDACQDYCRQVNDTGAAIRDANPDRIAFAASLPLPDVAAAVAELERVWNTLGASAVCLTSNYSGRYLGDPSFEPLFDELDRLHCPILLHPVTPPAFPKSPITGQILPMFEFIADTTRTLLDMIAAGTLSRHPNLKVVVPHSGSCLPVALDRMKGVLQSMGRPFEIPLSQLYFDLACDAFPHGVPILLTWTQSDHIVYGTDYPAIPEFVLRQHLKNAIECPELAGQTEDALWNNAQRLFTRK
jgi:predicted TIM-barrel fold metal-dependent hydrolase